MWLFLQMWKQHAVLTGLSPYSSDQCSAFPSIHNSRIMKNHYSHHEVTTVSELARVSWRIAETLKVTYSEERIKRAILHIFCDDHDWIGLCHNTLQEYHIRMLKLTHDRRLSKEVISCFVRAAWLQSLDGNINFCATTIWWQLQLSSAHITEFSST